MRKGMGTGMGKGYKNLIKVRDSKVHSNSAKGMKAPQRVNIYHSEPLKDYDDYLKKSREKREPKEYWKRNKSEEGGLVNRWFEGKDPIEIISVVDYPELYNEVGVRVTYKDKKNGGYKHFEIRGSKSKIEALSDEEILKQAKKGIEMSAGREF